MNKLVIWITFLIPVKIFALSTQLECRHPNWKNECAQLEVLTGSADLMGSELRLFCESQIHPLLITEDFLKATDWIDKNEDAKDLSELTIEVEPNLESLDRLKAFSEKTREHPNYEDCGLSDREIVALRKYIGKSFGIVNKIYRENENSAKALPYRRLISPFVDAINSALKKLKPTDVKVHRGTRLAPEEEATIRKTMQYVTRTVMSTSVSEDTALGFAKNAIFHIKHFSGVSLIYFNLSEEEVLFPLHTKFKVEEIKVIDEITHYYLEEVPKTNQ